MTQYLKCLFSNPGECRTYKACILLKRTVVFIYIDAELLKSVDVNTRDFSYQYAYPEYPETPRPLLASAWESNNFDAVDVLMNMKPDTRVLWTYEGSSKNPPKPVFFQVFF